MDYWSIRIKSDPAELKGHVLASGVLGLGNGK